MIKIRLYLPDSCAVIRDCEIGAMSDDSFGRMERSILTSRIFCCSETLRLVTILLELLSSSPRKVKRFSVIFEISHKRNETCHGWILINRSARSNDSIWGLVRRRRKKFLLIFNEAHTRKTHGRRVGRSSWGLRLKVMILCNVRLYWWCERCDWSFLGFVLLWDCNFPP